MSWRRRRPGTLSRYPLGQADVAKAVGLGDVYLTVPRPLSRQVLKHCDFALTSGRKCYTGYYAVYKYFSSMKLIIGLTRYSVVPNTDAMFRNSMKHVDVECLEHHSVMIALIPMNSRHNLVSA